MSFWKKYSGPVDAPTLRVLSLGAGVQSSVLALRAAEGEIGPMPDCAIFADVGWEPKAVYEHLDWLEKQLPFPVYRVSAGNIRDDAVAGINSTGQRFASMPFFLVGPEGDGMGRRQCTSEYKIKPVVRKIRDLCGLKRGQRARGIVVEQWIGISTDESHRMKQARDKWVKNRWPLLEEDFSRLDCHRWFAARFPGRKLPKSSCIGCPFHSNDEWRALSASEFEEACRFDDAVRNYPKMEARQYLHADRIPLRNVDLSTAAGHGQVSFLDECEGMCGL